MGGFGVGLFFRGVGLTHSVVQHSRHHTTFLLSALTCGSSGLVGRCSLHQRCRFLATVATAVEDEGIPLEEFLLANTSTTTTTTPSLRQAERCTQEVPVQHRRRRCEECCPWW